MAFLQTAVTAAHHFQASYKPNTGELGSYRYSNMMESFLSDRRKCVFTIPAVTDWIERLCSSSYKVTEYEGIPELVESINLQATG